MEGSREAALAFAGRNVGMMVKDTKFPSMEKPRAYAWVERAGSVVCRVRGWGGGGRWNFSSGDVEEGGCCGRVGTTTREAWLSQHRIQASCRWMKFLLQADAHSESRSF